MVARGIDEKILSRCGISKEELLYAEKSDLDEDLDFADRWLLVTNGFVCVVGKDVQRYDLNDLRDPSIVERFGVASLEANVGGSRKPLLFFSKSKLEAFSKIIPLLSKLTSERASSPQEIKTEEQSSELLQVSEGQSTNDQGAFSWLLRYVAKYRLQLALVLIFSILGTLASLVPPYLIEVLINKVLLRREAGLLATISLAVLGAYALGTLLGAGSSYFLNWLDQVITRDMRNDVYSHLQKLSMAFYDRMSSGRLLSRVVDDVGRTEWFLTWGVQQLVVNSLMTVGVMAAMFIIDWQLALLVLAPLPVLFLLFLLYSRVATSVYHRAWWKWADVDTYLTDAIEGTAVIKTFSQEEKEIRKFAEKLKGVFSANMATTVTDLKYFPLMDFSIVLSGIAVWFVGGMDILKGTLSLGALVALFTYMGMLYGPLFGLVSLADPLQQTKTSAERVLEIVKERPSLRDGTREIDVKGEIEFVNVSFGYDRFTPVVYDLNFKVPSGTMLGVAGPSGSGKTTLVKLLMRFYDPQGGSILVDGVNLREIRLSSWREQVGIVLQEPFLFDGSIAYNISYGLKSVSPEKVIAAAKAASAHDFVMRMPLAYDSWVGERGSMLSGGERQMISIARAIITDPRILIMDEATSSLDSSEERTIQTAISNIAKNRTTIIIAHRLSTIRHADKIIVMDHGTVVESGTHDELVKRGGLYARMYEAQYGSQAALERVNPSRE